MEILRFPGLGWELPISRVALSIGNLDIPITAPAASTRMRDWISSCGPWSAPLWARGPIMWHSSGIIIKII